MITSATVIYVRGAEAAVRVAPGISVEVAQPHPDGEEVGERPVDVLLRKLALLDRGRGMLLDVRAAVDVQPCSS